MTGRDFKKGEKMDKRFLVVTWSDDIGSDEGMDFARLSDAIKEAERFRKTEQYAAVYDKTSKTAYVVFGDPSTPVFSDRIHVLEF